MRIAVVSEVSARERNTAILDALRPFGHEVVNAGMVAGGGGPELTYIHTGFIAAALLNLRAVDLVVGGCGTGQGFLNSAAQYPGVVCGLILDPLDAFLFSQINAGNCASLALNKGYGWAGEVNLAFLFEKLFERAPGGGFPPHRSASQAQSRERLRAVSEASHKPFGQIVSTLDPEIVRTALSHAPFGDIVAECGFRFFEGYKEDVR